MRTISSQPGYRGSQVLLMTGQIDESDELAGMLANLLCRIALYIINGLAIGIESQKLMRYRRCPSGLNLVQMAEHIQTGPPSTIIQMTLS